MRKLQPKQIIMYELDLLRVFVTAKTRETMKFYLCIDEDVLLHVFDT